MSLRRNIFILLLGTVSAWSLLFAYNAPSAFGRDTFLNNPKTEADKSELLYADLEHEHAERLLERLAKHESSILASPKAGKESSSEKLAETLKAKEILEAQQNEFVKEIGNLKRKLKQIEKTSPQVQIIRNIPENQSSSEVDQAFLEQISRLKQRLVKERARAEQLEKEVQSLLKKAEGEGASQQVLVETLQKQNKALSDELSKLKAERVKLEEGEIASLKRQISRAFEEVKVCKAAQEQSEKQLEKVPELARRFSDLKEELANKSSETKNCLDQLEQSSELLSKLAVIKKKQVSEENENLMAETAAQLLDEPPVVQPKASKKARGRLKAKKSSAMNLSPALAAAVSAKQPAPAADVMIVEAVKKKINLRSGPGREHSPLMQVRRGTRLTVESREGDWFRVVAPTGGRAYVRSDVVKKLSKEGASIAQAPQKAVSRSASAERNLVPFGAVKLGGRTPDIETRALEHIRQGLSSRDARGKIENGGITDYIDGE